LCLVEVNFAKIDGNRPGILGEGAQMGRQLEEEFGAWNADFFALRIEF